MRSPSRLTPAILAELREQARGKVGPFVDPTAVRRLPDGHGLPRSWVDLVLGPDAAIGRRMPMVDRYLLELAIEVDGEHIAALRTAELQRLHEPKPVPDDTWWMRLSADLEATLGAPVSVHHHYSRHHYDGWRADRDHIILAADAAVDRWSRHAGQALCQTPSHPLSHLDPEPLPDHRTPTCRACLLRARALARREERDAVDA